MEIMHHAEILGYRPNLAAQALRTRRSRLVGVILTNLLNASFQTMTQVIQDRLEQQGYDTILSITDGDLGREDKSLRALFDRQVDGVIMLGSNGLVPLSPLLQHPAVPAVHVVRRLDPQPVESVLADDRHGAYEATSYLLSLGHRRIAMIVGQREPYGGNERRVGYIAALRDAGLKPERALLREGPYRPETGAAAVHALFSTDEVPTALLIANHEAAFGALPALVELGIDVPRELSVVVYEDAPWFGYWTPPLTVVDNRPTSIAETAVSILLGRLGHDLDSSRSLADEDMPAGSDGTESSPGSRHSDDVNQHMQLANVTSQESGEDRIGYYGRARLVIRGSCSSPVVDQT